jgi:hypothetical protein
MGVEMCSCTSLSRALRPARSLNSLAHVQYANTLGLYWVICASMYALISVCAWQAKAGNRLQVLDMDVSLPLLPCSRMHTCAHTHLHAIHARAFMHARCMHVHTRLGARVRDTIQHAPLCSFCTLSHITRRILLSSYSKNCVHRLSVCVLAHSGQ